MSLEIAAPRNLEEAATLLRIYMRDHSELNRLIAGVETGPRLMALCILKAIDAYNNFGAPVSATLLSFPSLSLLLDLATIEVLKSVRLLKIRNYLAYSDGGFNVDNEGNVQFYDRVISDMRAETRPLLDSVKLSANISGAFDGQSVGSEYGWLSGWTAAFTDSQ